MKNPNDEISGIGIDSWFIGCVYHFQQCKPKVQITDVVTMSCWGIPSVMHTTKSSSASIASKMALAAKGGGT